MKINNKKSSSTKRYLVPILIIAALLIGGGYVYAISNSILPSPLSNDQPQEVPPTNNPVPDEPVMSDNTDKENLGESPTPPNTVRTVTITAATVNNDLLQVRALIQGVVASGQCEISVTKDGSEILTQSVDVQAGPSSTTCRGFDLDISEIDAGTVAITVSYINNGQTSTSNAQDVIITR